MCLGYFSDTKGNEKQLNKQNKQKTHFTYSEKVVLQTLLTCKDL